MYQLALLKERKGVVKDDLSDWGDPDDNGNGDKKWRATREKILFYAGLIIIAASFINSEIVGGVFHYEFLLAGAALSGISIAQWGDRGGK